MITKTIVVLANSIKKGGRCLAGKELLSSSGDQYDVGGWIRPVTTKDGGAVSENSMSLALGHQPEPLEIIELPFEGPEPLSHQPENWLLPRPS